MLFLTLAKAWSQGKALSIPPHLPSPTPYLPLPPGTFLAGAKEAGRAEPPIPSLWFSCFRKASDSQSQESSLLPGFIHSTKGLHKYLYPVYVLWTHTPCALTHFTLR